MDQNVMAAHPADAPAKKIPLIALASYFGFGMGQCFSFGLVGTFILFFYTDILGISPVSASVIFLIARVWDAFNDPIFAGLIDSLNMKRGKYRPFLGFMPIVIVGITILAFINIDGSVMTKTIYAGATYILWGTLYTISDLPFWSMTTVLSDHPQERAKAATCAMLGVNAGIGSAMVFFPYLAKLFADGRTDQGYLPAVCIMMVAGIILTQIGYVPNQTQDADTLFYLFLCVSLLPMIGSILRIVVLKFYTFNEAEHAEIVRKISQGEFDITHKL